MTQHDHPALYEINPRLWLQELSQTLGRPASLDDVPEEALDRLAALGFDWVWLLGVWQTGPEGQRISRTEPHWRQEYQAVLPDLQEADICGSPFAIRAYSVAAALGGDAALARLRQRLRQRGLRLMLDFVPNHTARDHPWVTQHPEYYVAGDEALLGQQSQNYCRITRGDGSALILAHGRDPYFPGWPDTLQLNYRHAGLRQAMRDELRQVAHRCDGVRCDMAMLLLPDVFQSTWGERALPRDGTPPVDGDFWPEAIAQVQETHPQFLFLAEVYWDREWILQQQGFAYTYDKRLYDRLRAQEARAVHGHLGAELAFQRKSARFLENHDEPRAAAVFPWPVHQAAAVVTYLVPGLRFFHEGQLEGRRIKSSLHLGRRAAEPVDAGIETFYQRLLACLQRPEVRHGSWQLLQCHSAWEGNPTWEQFLAFRWRGESGTVPEPERLLITVNDGPTQGQCYVLLPEMELGKCEVRLRDLLSPACYVRRGEELVSRGLYLDLPAWGYHVFEITQA